MEIMFNDPIIVPRVWERSWDVSGSCPRIISRAFALASIRVLIMVVNGLKIFKQGIFRFGIRMDQFF